MDPIFEQIRFLGENFDAAKIVLFGSRARGDGTKRSDIDLAIYGVDLKNQAAFLFNIDGIDTLLQFDIIFINSNTNSLLLENIEKDGVSLYAKM